jgi:hypothetical protein
MPARTGMESASLALECSKEKQSQPDTAARDLPLAAHTRRHLRESVMFANNNAISKLYLPMIHPPPCK